MNEIKIEDINNVYDLLKKAENKGDEIIVRLLDSKAVIYYSDNLDIFNIDIIKKYDKHGLMPRYHNLSCLRYKEFYSYVKFLCNNYRFNYHLDEDI